MRDKLLMKNNNKMKIYALVFMLLCMHSLSCKKDVLDKNDFVAYVAQNLSAYNEIPTNTTDTVISNLGLIYAGKTDVGFPALLIEPSRSDVEITGWVDNNPELIKAYNSLYHSDSPIIPDGLFKIDGNGKVSIKAGETQSIDSIKIKINNISGLKVGKTTYVVPVVMECAEKNVKLKSRLMFVRYNIIVHQANTSISDLSGLSDIFLLNVPNLDRNVFVQASLSKVIHQPTEVSVEEVDSKTFLDAYNTEHNSSYLPFPKEAYTLLQNSATIPANKKVSAQSIQIQLTDMSLFNTNQAYLLALRIKENGVVSLADPKNNTVYIRMQKNNLDVNNAVLNGEQIDGKDWVINALEHYRDFVPANILDENHTTVWISNGELPQWLTLDMGMTQTVKGFSIVPNYEFIDLDFINMEVLSSNDGKNWNLEGEYLGSPTSPKSSAYRPDFKTIKFINPVTARYFKFNITKTTRGDFSGMAELYGFK